MWPVGCPYTHDLTPIHQHHQPKPTGIIHKTRLKILSPFSSNIQPNTTTQQESSGAFLQPQIEYASHPPIVTTHRSFTPITPIIVYYYYTFIQVLLPGRLDC